MTAPKGGLGARLRRGREWLHRTFVRPEDPMVGVEVRARSVGVVRLAREGRKRTLGAAAALSLPEGALRLSMAESNVVDAAAFRATLRAALEKAGVAGGARVGLVLPDAVAKMTLLGASEIAGRSRREADELLRFKLRKGVPFDVREARLAWAVGAGGGALTLVAAVAGPVLAGYEEACRAEGLEPGFVEPASVALVGACLAGHGEGDRVLVNWDEGYVSILVVRGSWPVVVRTITGDASGAVSDVAREVTSTLVYFRERLGGGELAGAVVRSAALPPERAVAALEGVLERPVELADAWGTLLPSAWTGEAQALAGAAACVGGHAA